MAEETVPPELIRKPGQLWDANADFWDGLMGDEGSRFYRLLVAPAQMRLLDLQPEAAFPKEEPKRHSFDWSNYHQIPPILVARLRPA